MTALGRGRARWSPTGFLSLLPLKRSPKIACCEVTPLVTHSLSAPHSAIKGVRVDTWLADTDAFSGSGHLLLLNFTFFTTFKKENLSNSLQILRSVFIKWSYRLFSVKGCSSLKRKFCTSCAYRRPTHAAGLAAHSEVRSLFCLVT